MLVFRETLYVLLPPFSTKEQNVQVSKILDMFY